LFFRQTADVRGPINKEGKRWQTGKKIKAVKKVAAAAGSPAVARVAAVAVRVVVDNPVDSVAVAAVAATADASLSYR